MALYKQTYQACDDKPAWFDVLGLAVPASILVSSRRRREDAEEGTDSKSVSREV